MMIDRWIEQWTPALQSDGDSKKPSLVIYGKGLAKFIRIAVRILNFRIRIYPINPRFWVFVIEDGLYHAAIK
jgi:hypothetical protein